MKVWTDFLCKHDENLIFLEHIDLSDTGQRQHLGRRSRLLPQIRKIDTVVRAVDDPATKVERHRAVDTVGAEEKVLRERDRVKDVASLSEDLLPRLDVLEPLLAADKGARPQRHRIALLAEIGKSERVARLGILLGRCAWIAAVACAGGSARHDRLGSRRGAFACRNLIVDGHDEQLQRNGLAVDLVQLVLVDHLGLDHEECVIEEENLQLGAFALRAAALLERTFEDELSLLVAETQIDGFALLEDQLLVELSECEAILALSGLYVDLGEELFDNLDDLGDRLLVRVVFRGILVDLL